MPGPFDNLIALQEQWSKLHPATGPKLPLKKQPQDPFGKILQDAASGVSAGINDIAKHPEHIIGDVVNSATLPVALGAKGVGAIIGGKTQRDTDHLVHSVQVATTNDPISSAEIAGGAVVTVVGAVTGGVVSTAGIALMAKGTQGIISDVMKMDAAQKQEAAKVDAARKQQEAQQAAAAQTAVDAVSPSTTLPVPVSVWQAFTKKR